MLRPAGLQAGAWNSLDGDKLLFGGLAGGVVRGLAALPCKAVDQKLALVLVAHAEVGMHPSRLPCCLRSYHESQCLPRCLAEANAGLSPI